MEMWGDFSRRQTTSFPVWAARLLQKRKNSRLSLVIKAEIKHLLTKSFSCSSLFVAASCIMKFYTEMKKTKKKKHKYIICLVSWNTHTRGVSAGSRSHRWLRSTPSFCCFSLTVPTSQLSAVHVSLMCSICKRSLVQRCCCWSTRAGKWKMSFMSRRAVGGLMEDGLMERTSTSYYCSLPHIQSHLAPFVPIKVRFVSGAASWTGMSEHTALCSTRWTVLRLV